METHETAQERERGIRLNVPGKDKVQSLCTEPDGSLCFFFASDGIAFFHAHGRPDEAGVMNLANLYTEGELGSETWHCGDKFTVGMSGGTARVRIDNAAGQWFVEELRAGIVPPSLVLSEASNS